MTLQIIPGNRNIPIPLCARLCSAVWARLSFGVPIRGYTRGLRSVSVRIGRLRIHFLCRFCLVQRLCMGCTALLRVRNGEFALQIIRSEFGVRGRKISTSGLCLPPRHFSSKIYKKSVSQLIFTRPTIVSSFLATSS